jgi:hypothetical protein
VLYNHDELARHHRRFGRSYGNRLRPGHREAIVAEAC